MDPREQALIDATRRIMENSNYDPHFAHVGEREIMETKLFLARMDALQMYYRNLLGFKINHVGELIPMFSVNDPPPVPFVVPGWMKDMPPAGEPELNDKPIPMIIFCPRCGVQHVDAAEPHKEDCQAVTIAEQTECICGAWLNPPHRSHLCHDCGHIWRPSLARTTGVAEIRILGDHDHPPIRGKVGQLAPPRWRHKVRQSIYTEVCRGDFQNSGELSMYEGYRMIAYRGDDGRFWFRLEKEFDDGRFEPFGYPAAVE